MDFVPFGGNIGSLQILPNGLVQVAGDYRQQDRGLFSFVLDEGGSNGQVQVTGNAFLGSGTILDKPRLGIDLTPALQQSLTGSEEFTLLTSGSPIFGEFFNIANGNRISFPIGSFQVNYGPSSEFDPNSLVLSGFLLPIIRTTWNGGAGNWTDTNWNPAVPNGFPNDLDDPENVYRVFISSGEVTLDQPIAISGLNLFGTILTTSGNGLSLNGPGTWQAGTLGGDDTFTIGSNGTLAIRSPSSKTLGNGSDPGRTTLVNDGTIDHIGATVDVTGGDTNDPASLILNNGQYNISDGATLRKKFNSSPTKTLPSFVNSTTGVLNKTGDGSAAIGLLFTNDGLVNVNGGTLQLSADTTTSGLFHVDEDATLRIDQEFTLNSGGSIGGTGTVDLRGTLVLNTDLTLAHLLLPGPGTVIGNRTLTIPDGGDVDWTSGTVGGTTTMTIADGATLTFNAANSKVLGNGNEAGRTTLVNNGTINHDAGTFDITSGDPGFPGGDPNDLGSLVVNNGQYNLGATIREKFNGSPTRILPSFENSFTGVLNKTGAGSATIGLPFTNDGLVNVNGGTLRLSADTTTSGLFHVDEDGTLRIDQEFTLNSGGSIGGTGTVDLRGTLVLNTDLTLANLLLPGTIIGDSMLTIPDGGDVDWPSGTLGGTTTMTIADGATLTFSQNSQKILGNGNEPGRTTLVNNRNGTINHDAGVFEITSGDPGFPGGDPNDLGSLLVNNGQYNIGDGVLIRERSNGSPTRILPSFENSATGVLHKSGSGSSQINLPFINNGTVVVEEGALSISDLQDLTDGTLPGGTYEVSDGGTLTLSSNITTNAATVILRGPGSTFARIDTLADNQGRFEIDESRNFSTVGNLVNSGTIVVGPASTLTVNGTYLQTGLNSSIDVGGMLDVTVGTPTFADGAMLTGDGVLMGPVTIGANGVISPGASPGVLTTDDLTLADGAIFKWELDELGLSDAVLVDGELVLGANLTLALVSLGGTPGPLTEYTLFAYSGSDPTPANWTLDASAAPDWNALGASVNLDTEANRIYLVGLSLALEVLLGDANNDSLVSGSDLIAVQQNFGKAGPPNDGTLLGDANDDGVVSGSDLIAVQQNFGNALAPLSGTVPEPTTAAILILGCLGLRRRQRAR